MCPASSWGHLIYAPLSIGIERCKNVEKGHLLSATLILLDFEYIVEGRALSNMRLIRGVGRSRFKSYEKKKIVQVVLHLLECKWLKMKLHMHLNGIAILICRVKVWLGSAKLG